MKINVPLIGQVLLLLSSLELTQAAAEGLRRGPHAGRKAYPGSTAEVAYFSEALSGDDSVVVFESGPFRFTASCKTIAYDSNSYSYSYSPSSSFSPASSPSSSSSLPTSTYPSSTSWESFWSSKRTSSDSSSHSFSISVPQSPDPCGKPSTSVLYSSTTPTDTTDTSFAGYSHSPGADDDSMDGYYSYSYNSDYHYDSAEFYSFASLELTYTAEDADYLYGYPHYSTFPDELALVGPYEAGESRSQIVFARSDGGYAASTLQSLSGHYASINGDSTIGIHRDSADYLPGGVISFPEGVDCMMAGFITYVPPS